MGNGLGSYTALPGAGGVGDQSAALLEAFDYLDHAVTQEAQ
jgi:hypothetical protein